MDESDLTRPYDPDVVLLDNPTIYDASDLIIEVIDLHDIETEQVVLLDTMRLSESEIAVR
jgi:hypothetical protein